MFHFHRNPPINTQYKKANKGRRIFTMTNISRPEWYDKAFDSYISTGEELDNKNVVQDKGYMIPENDGSKSSIAHDAAVINNSFNEKSIRDSLQDIYLSSHHKLMANNNDNVHFYKWEGKMSDMTMIANTTKCEFRLPWDLFVYPDERDKFKISQFYRKWIKVEDILNNWEIFKWHVLVFINQRVYSEYEIYIQEQEVIIRFDYNKVWAKNDYPVYIYKFDTNFQKRVLISKELLYNQWQWQLPYEYIGDMKIKNNPKIIMAVNKISDQNIRTDKNTHIEVLGDNLEFLDVNPDTSSIDLSTMSQINVDYINSESSQFLWLSIFVPKFMQEYPKFLVTDVIFRPYLPKLRTIDVLQQSIPNHVKVEKKDDFLIKGENVRQLFVDYNPNSLQDYNGWTNIIRPVVLSDAYTNHIEPYDVIRDEIDVFKITTSVFSDGINNFKFYIDNDNTKNAESWNKWIDLLKNQGKDIYDAQARFLDKRLCPRDPITEDVWIKFVTEIELIRDAGWDEIYISYDFYDTCNILVQQCITLTKKFYVADIVRGIWKKYLWCKPDQYKGKIRYQRPVDASNFWCFEYDVEDEVWRPRSRKVTHQFPDVYFIGSPNNEPIEPNLVFKAFFFYSDTINPRELSSDLTKSNPAWDEELLQYEDKYGAYHDIFMEKFYWMAIDSIYKGLLFTNSRWEILEYIVDNPSYIRFNNLFIKTMDPYYKLGLATYLKSSDYEFPFDDAVNKMKEAITLKWQNYDKITNFEIYLHNQWIPSYFDYITKIMDDTDLTNRIVKRPPLTFDIFILADKLNSGIMDNTYADMNPFIIKSTECLSIINANSYKVNITAVQNIISSLKRVISSYNDIDRLIKVCQEDQELYSLSTLNEIRSLLRDYQVNDILSSINSFSPNGGTVNIYSDNLTKLNSINDDFNNLISQNIIDTVASINSININSLLSALYNLDSYVGNTTLIDQLNQFTDPWSTDVKNSKNKLLSSILNLNGYFNPNNPLTNNDLDDITALANIVKDDIEDLNSKLIIFWDQRSLAYDTGLLSLIDGARTKIIEFNISVDSYMADREMYIRLSDNVKVILNNLNTSIMNDSDIGYNNDILFRLGNILMILSTISNDTPALIVDNLIDAFKSSLTGWILYTQGAYDLFEVLRLSYIDLSNLMNNKYVSNQWIIDGCIDYINQANTLYVSNAEWPTYMDIYEVTGMSVASHGIGYTEGNTAYIPRIGAFTLNDVQPSNGSVQTFYPLIDTNNHYRKSFLNPSRSEPYVCHDAGLGGMGLSVKMESVSSTPIIRDGIASSTIAFIYQLLNTIRISSSNPNPYENADISRLLQKISDVQNQWYDIASRYENNLTSNIKDTVMVAVTKLTELAIEGNALINIRAGVDVKELLRRFNSVIETIKYYRNNIPWTDPLLISAENSSEITYIDLQSFYDRGSTWNNVDKLNELIERITAHMDEYHAIIDEQLDSTEKTEVIVLLSELASLIYQINDALLNLSNHRVVLTSLNSEFKGILDPLDYTHISDKSYYRIFDTSIASPGHSYHVGQIVSVTIPSSYVEIGGYYICFQIVSIDKEGVASVKPMMDYALTENLWGVFDTDNHGLSGTGLKVDIKTKSVQPELLMDVDNYFIPNQDQFDDSELMTFKFDNIHDLELTYEVFVGGRQVTDFYQRHEDTNYQNQRKIDVIYLNANEVNNLKNSSLYIPADHYFIYKINSIEIKDPGTGYHPDQEVYVDADEYCLKLLVSKIISEPYKGIEEINLIDGKLIYERFDPAGQNLKVVDDQQNNIDDEFHVSGYDKITANGNVKSLSLQWPNITYTEGRYDNLQVDDRNQTFMYPSVPMIDPVPDLACDNGDPDFHWYQGNRIDNSATGNVDDPWNGISNTEEVTDPFIEDHKRTPPDQPIRSEFQLIKRVLIHYSQFAPTADYTVNTHDDMPLSMIDLPDAVIGKTMAVTADETKENHRCIYTIYAISPIGVLMYDDGIVADQIWNEIDVNWMDMDYYPGLPNIRQQYPDAPWMEADSYDKIKKGIANNQWKRTYVPKKINRTTYIHNLTPNDLSVFNWTTKTWEDLNDDTRWKLEVRNDPDKKNWGFKLTFLLAGEYEYDMKLYLNKTPDTQTRNNTLLRSAKVDIFSSIINEINILPTNIKVNTGRSIRIRKLFPYKQVEHYSLQEVDRENGMSFKLVPYMHYRNEIHLEDIKLYNHRTMRFEDITNTDRFDVWYRNITREDETVDIIPTDDVRVVDDVTEDIIPNVDVQILNQDEDIIQPFTDPDQVRIISANPDVIPAGTEYQTKVTACIVTYPGDGYYTGSAWAYNADRNIQIFGDIIADAMSGQVISFKPRHIPVMPEEGNYEFMLYQSNYIGTEAAAKLYVEIRTNIVQLYDDGWIHSISNIMAVPPKGEFKIIPKYELNGTFEYDIIIDKTPRRWRFMSDDWMISPTFTLPGYQASPDRFYVLVNNQRFPMINCSTGKPSLDVKSTKNGTEVTFLSMYRRNEQLEIRTLPYPVRSVYIQRSIPKHGYINLEGKINKPLDKNHFEFWVNGKLLHDEVTIITPTRIILHGLTSLKNLEILEINRDQDEYFSDEFVNIHYPDNNLRPFPVWDYTTYLDDTLKGTLKDDNYSIDEQGKLLTPVWKQVARNHPEYRDYPENTDTDRDILLRAYIPEDLPLPNLSNSPYQYMTVDAPRLEGMPLVGRSMKWSQFKWKPIDLFTIINLLNEEWKDEISTDPYLNLHVIISSEEWYGTAARLYDEYGILTHNLNDALYKVYDYDILSINDNTHNANIIKNVVEMNLD